MHLPIVVSNFRVEGQTISGPEGAFWIIPDKITKQAMANLGIYSRQAPSMAFLRQLAPL